VRLLREENGMSLIELLVAAALLVVVLTATVRPLNAYERTASQNRAQNDAQAQARGTLDRMARELRNVAGQTQFIEKATASDLVYQTIDPLTSPGGTNNLNVERVRYCLHSSTQVLWRQTQTWTTGTPPALPSTTSCPSSAWTTQAIATDQVTNGSRTVFTYNDNSDLTNITQIHADLYIDVSQTLRPPESRLESGVYLRNQNKAPIASFTATVAGNKHVLLNGSASSDPEGGSLSFKWFDGSTQIGSGQTCDCIALNTGNRTITLTVADQSGITDSVSQTVKVK
jgi:prepilin-type N-terminal cleavage/methylation domain-containing protein